MVNYDYGKFINNLSTIAGPLYDLLKKETLFEWNNLCTEAFDKIKYILSSNQTLTHFNPKLPIILSCDASNIGIGAVLAHRFTKNVEKPISFASRSLTTAEKNYSSIHREALAIV